MWILDTNTNKWIIQEEVLNKDSFDIHKQDMESFRLYSKCLSGAIYNKVLNRSDLFSTLKYKDDSNWIDDNPYNSAPIGNGKSTHDPSYIDYINNYGFTEKMYFNYQNVLDKNTNSIEVETAIDTIDINATFRTLSLNDRFLRSESLILVKGLKTYVSFIPLNSDIIYHTDTDGIFYYNNDNGIYKYQNYKLTKIEFDDSVYQKGLIVFTKDFKEFSLCKNKAGVYTNEFTEFNVSESFVMKTQIDYANQYDIVWNKGIKIDNRNFLIGSKGSIFLFLDSGISNDTYLVIPNKYRYNLLDCKYINNKLYIVGEEGCLLIMDTNNYEITYTKLETEFDLNSIDILDENNMFVVGNNNNIYYTKNGRDFNKISIDAFNDFNYTGVTYYSNNRAYIVGSNGAFLKLEKANDQWMVNKKNVIIKTNTVSKTEYVQFNGIYSSNLGNIPINFDTDVVTDYVTFYSDNTIYFFNVLNETFYIVKPDNNSYDHKITSLTTNIALGCFVVISNGNAFEFNTIYPAIDETITNVTSTPFYSKDWGTTFKFVISHTKYTASNDQEEVLIGGGLQIISNNYFGVGQGDVYTIDYTFVPKMIYLDYDIAAKLYYFDNNGNYILPSGNFDLNNLTGDFNVTALNPGWLDYNKESYSEFIYSTDMNENSKVKYNTYFRRYVFNINDDLGKIRIFNGLTTISENDYKPLIPSDSAVYLNSANSTVNTIQPPTTAHTCFISKKLLCLRTSLLHYFQIGDILYMNNSVLDGTFIVNNIMDIAGERFIYLRHNFNRNIINSLMKLASYEFINLNLFSDNDVLLNNLNRHKLSTGYNFSVTDNILNISAKLNNSTAYYDMSITFGNSSTSYAINLDYDVRMKSFKYFANYSLFNMLGSIDSKYHQNYKFEAFNNINNIPGNNNSSLTPNNVWIDTGKATNMIKFGSDLIQCYESIWLNTFVDIILENSNGDSFYHEKYLIINKDISYNDDGSINSYNVYFDKPFDNTLGVGITKLDIIARNLLFQVSSDLNLLNNIQNEQKIRIGVRGEQYNYFLPDFTFKPTTDSYAKILLSDKNIKSDISALIYTDNEYELALNLINNNYIYGFEAVSASIVGNNTIIQVNNINNVVLNSTSVLVKIYYNGSESVEHYGTYNSSNDEIVINAILDTDIITGLDNNIDIITVDTLMNIMPVDLYKIDTNNTIGKDSLIEAKYVNYNLYLPNSLTTMSLSNDMKYQSRYIFKDGLGIMDIFDRYSWILEGDVYNGTIGEEIYTENDVENRRLIWYAGLWKYGRFFADKAYSGTFINSDLYGANLYSMDVIFNATTAIIGNTFNNTSTKVYNSRIYDTTLYGGSYYNVRTYDTDTYNIKFYHGIFNSGNFRGTFMGGIFVNGTFNGIFNSNYRNAYFLNGNYDSGEFENGMFYNGQFTNRNGISRFGTKSSISKPSIWRSGSFSGTSFHSGIVYENGVIVQSNKHKYTVWETGTFNSGDFYGGVVLNMDFKGGTFHSGIVTQIQIINVDIPKNEITLNGDFYFNPNDKIYIYDKENSTSVYSEMGNINDYKSYLVVDTTRDIDPVQNRKITKVILNKNLSSLFTTIPAPNPDYHETNIVSVSYFNNGVIKNGIFENGIFGKNITMESGDIYWGSFEGNWGQL